MPWLLWYDGAVSMYEPLTWESSFAIARALMRAHPKVDLEQVSLGMLYDWVLALPDFDDDPALVNDTILNSIYQEWYEEVHPI